MAVDNLPICEHRGDTSTKWFPCSHPIVNRRKVCGDICRLCKYSQEPGKYKDEIKAPCGPSLMQMAGNLVTAMVRLALNGFGMVTAEEYEGRLSTCEGCHFRSGNRCKHMACGCYLPEKARWASENCPEKKWAVPAEKESVDAGDGV